MARSVDVLGGGVSAQLLGGLGNQLFIYASALAQAERLGVPVTLLSDYGASPNGFGLELDSFEHAGRIVARAPKSSHRWSRAFSRRAARGTNLFVEASFEYDPEIEHVRPGVELRGYFQSWRYFTRIEDKLRGELTTRTRATPWLTSWSERLAAEGSTIAIHVRRGDYTDPVTAAFHGLTSVEYYRRSLRLLRSSGHDGRLVVFSDHPELAAHELSELGELLVVDDAGTPLDTMTLMSRCDAIVMANSSFAWWAAWLSEPAEGPVVAPRPWFAHRGSDTRDLLLPRWVTLDHRASS